MDSSYQIEFLVLILSKIRPQAILILCSILSLVWSILAIELALVWNGVTPINSLASVGQFIPLTIGVLGLVQVLYAIFRPLVVRSLYNYRVNYDALLIS